MSIPLKVDLTAFFNNINEKVMILVDPQSGNVAEVEKRIKSMFEMDFEISIGFKTDEGYYIPPGEPIEILRHVVSVIAFKRNTGNIDEVEGNTNGKENPITDVGTTKNKRCYGVLDDFKTSTPAPNFAKKQKVLDSVTSNTQDCADITPITNNVELFVEGKRLATSHRETTKKSKKSDFTKASEGTSSNDNKNSAESYPKFKSHIVYDDSGNEINNDLAANTKKKKILLVCNLENGTKKGRIFRIDPLAENGFKENEKTYESSARCSKLENTNNEENSVSQFQNDETNVENDKVPKMANNNNNNKRDIYMATYEEKNENSNEPKLENMDNNNRVKSQVDNENSTASEINNENDEKNNNDRTTHQFNENTKNGDECDESKLNSISNSTTETFQNSFTKSTAASGFTDDSNASKQTIPSIKETFVEDSESYFEKSNESENCENQTNNDNSVGNGSLSHSTKSVDVSESLITCDDSEIMMLNETETETDNTCESANLSTNEYTLEKLLSNSSELTDLPNIGDLIIFKLKLQKGEISEFFVGICEYINKRTKTLKLQLKDGLSQISKIPSKYSCNADDSDIRSLNVKLQDFIEARVCKI